MNLLLALWRVIPVRYRSQYLASQIYVSLISSGPETQLIVSRQGEFAARSNPSEPVENGEPNEVTALTEIKPVATLTGVSDLLRDATFMIFQLVHGRTLPGRNWQGMKHFVGGLDILAEFHSTGDEQLLTRAMGCFRHAGEADAENYKSLYIQGSLLLVQRDDESIAKALNLLTRALKTDELDFRALVNTGLANCYVQQFHRLTKRGADVLKIARHHAEEARRDWDESRQRASQKTCKGRTDVAGGQYHPWILATSGLVWGVNKEMVSYKTREEAHQKFVEAVEFSLKAIEIESDSGRYYNQLGWILLTLAEWEAPGMEPQWGFLPKGSPAQKAEHCFKESLRRDPTSKFTYANLCLLYATPWYRKRGAEERKEYVQQCLENGEKATRFDPQYIHGYRDLAFSLLRYEEFDEAYQRFEKALEMAPTAKKKEEMIGDARKVLKEIGVMEGNGRELEGWEKLLLVSDVGRGQDARIS